MSATKTAEMNTFQRLPWLTNIYYVPFTESLVTPSIILFLISLVGTHIYFTDLILLFFMSQLYLIEVFSILYYYFLIRFNFLFLTP